MMATSSLSGMLCFTALGFQVNIYRNAFKLNPKTKPIRNQENVNDDKLKDSRVTYGAITPLCLNGRRELQLQTQLTELAFNVDSHQIRFENASQLSSSISNSREFSHVLLESTTHLSLLGRGMQMQIRVA
ncbi:uncharacterized protein IWZ02DRAFT_483324 [Phyllosticta citriasiana]|uniref:uncharacterized protein n=1 Tax=Phyllosticta citriasiana TaxID=595635 RepID=UPI0030FD6A70